MIERYTLPDMGRVWSEHHKFSTWLSIELAACEAYTRKGKIPRHAWKEISQRAAFDSNRILEVEATVKHDVIAFLTVVGEAVGPSSRYIHLGMTSSDLLDTGLALQLKEAGRLIERRLSALRTTTKQLANRFRHVPAIGRTHGVHAEPTTAGWRFAVWWKELERHQVRMRRAIIAISVGKLSGPVGTYSGIDPSIERHVCQRLGLQPAPISTQVVQRDRHAEFATTLALVAGTIEKMATEIRHLQRTEVLEAEEPFSEGQKGSSAMPHKRNPIVCERLCGLARVVRGNAMAMLESMALWHERDISHSSVERVALPDSCIAVDYMLAMMNEVLEGLIIYPRRMLANLQASKGLVFSQKILLALMHKGMLRERAYEIVQRNAMKCWRNGHSFEWYLSRDPHVKQHLTARELKACFSLKPYLRHVPMVFKRLGL